MTEAELKTKWCPMHKDAGYTNIKMKCIGSECAMHRVKQKDEWLNAHEKKLMEHHYCGLAGKPST